MSTKKGVRPLFPGSKRGLTPFLFLLVLALLCTLPGQAHKGATAKFTYNGEVYSVFLNRCGRCHVDGGVGPMSLLKYEDAAPWAESLRVELLEAALGDPHDFVKAAHRDLSARELDIVLDWATGGTPEGDKATMPLPTAFRNAWAGGDPDVAVSLPSPIEIPSDVMETSTRLVLPIEIDRPRSAIAIDLLPGNPAIVRDAVISLRSGDARERTLATWVPRQRPQRIVLKPPVRLVPGSEIVARIHYKKTWKYEGQPMADRSTIGLYFGD
jgi:hypothetical protein